MTALYHRPAGFDSSRNNLGIAVLTYSNTGMTYAVDADRKLSHG